MNDSSFKVLGIGAETRDIFYVVPEFSAEEGVREAFSRAEDFGGPVATALEVLRAHGHACELLDGSPAEAVVLVRQRDGARQIVFRHAEASEPVFEPSMLNGVRLLHLNGRHEKACRAAIAEAQLQQVEISFDGGAGRYRESIRDLFEASHVRIVSRDFAEKASGCSDLSDMAEKLLREPARLLVITDGVLGCHVGTPCGTWFHQAAHPASPLVDTTGCGDVFHGAFLHGWLSCWPLKRCAEQASRLAAKNAEGLGGRHVLKSSNFEP
ncbi:MAG: carbohydrate kinase family protein [Prosthecobacter sp.]